MLNWFLAIPLAVVVVVVGVLNTVFSAVWTSGTTSRCLKQQLAAERRLVETTRIFESRRDLYLEAAEAITVALTCIGRLADLDRTAADILKPFEDQIGKIARIHLLAGPDVGKLIVTIGSEIGRAVIELTMARVPLEISWRHVKASEGRAVAEPDNSSEVAQAWAGLLTRQFAFAERCVRSTAKLAPTIGEALIAIRKDLDVPAYVPDFPKLLGDTASAQADHLIASFAALLEELKISPPAGNPTSEHNYPAVSADPETQNKQQA